MELYNWTIWFLLCSILCGWVVIFSGAEIIKEWNAVLRKIMPWVSTGHIKGVRLLFLLFWLVIAMIFILGMISSEFRAIF